MRARFAPSPTGDLHVGNARTALLAWLQARRAGGRFVLRVEDLDVGRVREEYVRTQLADLRWLGIDWDEGPDVGGGYGPYRQSERLPMYRQAIERLRQQGRLYECFCSRREIAAAAAAPHLDDEGPPYPGFCRDLTETDRRSHPGPAALRFRVPPGEVHFHDAIFGAQISVPANQIGDFVVQRKDGIPAYQLAVVVDDAAMAITHVLRGADLLISTVRQILLYDALELRQPLWTHVPLMLTAEGERLSKRSGALSLRELRDAGIAPERLVGWLAASVGLAGADDFVSPRELVETFDPERLPRRDTPLDFPDWLRGD